MSGLDGMLLSNDTHTVLVISPLYNAQSADPNSPVDMTGAISVAVVFQLETDGPTFEGTGLATIVSGLINYKPSVADLNPPNVPSPGGLYALYCTVTFSDGTDLPLWPDYVQITTAP